VSRVYLRKSGYKAMAYDNSRGHGIAFDDIDNLPSNYDAVKVLCDWMRANMDDAQRKAVCDALSDEVQEAQDDGYERTGFTREGPQSGLGGAGPWGTAGVKPSKGAMDAGLRKLGQSFRDDAAAVSFDRIFNPNDREQSEDAVVDVDFFGRPVGEASPRYDHLSPSPLWVTMR